MRNNKSESCMLCFVYCGAKKPCATPSAGAYWFVPGTVCSSTARNGIPSAMLPFTPIATTFEERTDPAALVIGPTGLGLGADGTLFVADTLRGAVYFLSAGTAPPPGSCAARRSSELSYCTTHAPSDCHPVLFASLASRAAR
jgi:hypothetical protein